MNNYQNCLFSICNIISQPSQNINIKTNIIFNLDNKPLCQTLSNAFDTPQNTKVTSSPFSRCDILS